MPLYYMLKKCQTIWIFISRLYRCRND